MIFLDDEGAFKEATLSDRHLSGVLDDSVNLELRPANSFDGPGAEFVLALESSDEEHVVSMWFDRESLTDLRNIINAALGDE